jgi:hypothetical protein
MLTNRHWKEFHKKGFVGSDEILIEMIQELSDIETLIIKIYGREKADIFISYISNDLFALESFANARGLLKI